MRKLLLGSVLVVAVVGGVVLFRAAMVSKNEGGPCQPTEEGATSEWRWSWSDFGTRCTIRHPNGEIETFVFR